jgi:hypothetical protein
MKKPYTKQAAMILSCRNGKTVPEKGAVQREFKEKLTSQVLRNCITRDSQRLLRWVLTDKTNKKWNR